MRKAENAWIDTQNVLIVACYSYAVPWDHVGSKRSKAQTMLPHRGPWLHIIPLSSFYWTRVLFILQKKIFISRFIKEKSLSFWWIILHKALILPGDLETVMRSALGIYRWWLITFNYCQLLHNVESKEHILVWWIRDIPTSSVLQTSSPAWLDWYYFPPVQSYFTHIYSKSAN